ncbi:hypothetical protein GCM10009682_29520 [Luedemannella flava]|uniref:Uncharacterized protein n=1 Tax=Luedemannella flava TaxID=349316 RepID=A0ABN2M0X8_9ACTN
MGVDQSGQDGGIGMVHHRLTFRERRVARSDRDDAVALHVDLRPTGEETLAIESMGGPDHKGRQHA